MPIKQIIITVTSEGIYKNLHDREDIKEIMQLVSVIEIWGH